MKKVFFLVVITILVIAVSGTRIEKIPARFSIEISNEVLTFNGFGVSAAWWAQEIGKNSEVMEKIVRLLFSKKYGIGINIYKYYIGAGEPNNIKDSWRKANTLEVNPGIYDLSRDEDALRVLKRALDFDVTKVVAFAYSPPARMTISGFVDGGFDGNSNLRSDMYDDFAKYLIDIVELLISEGIPVTELSPVNEPQWFWDSSKGQEGAHYSPDEVVKLLREIIKEAEKRNLNIKINAPESGEWKSSRKYADAMFTDQLINEKISEFHVHSYWSSSLDKKLFVNYLERRYPDKKIVMSEWCEMVNGRDYSMDSALTLAREIIDDILTGKVIEWHYWIAVSKYDFRDGLIYVDYGEDGNIKNITPTKRLWVMGNFSKFVEIGSKVVNLSYEKNGYLEAIAFKSLDEEEIVIVILNPSDFPHELFIDFQNEKFKLSNMYVTDKEHDLEEIKLSSSETITIFPQSVSTLIYKK